MMNKMRGRDLGHPGCLIGLTTGLILGIVLGAVLAVENVPFNLDLLIWLGLTVGLALLGWIIGSALSPRFPALEEKTAEEKSGNPEADEQSANGALQIESDNAHPNTSAG
jgi:hypothetical protein